LLADNGERLARSGKHSPYREGKPGVLEESTYADLLWVDGNPWQNLKVMEDYEKNFLLMMNDGVL
jgi:imidazolonepropionase-like amidohydrolase